MTLDKRISGILSDNKKTTGDISCLGDKVDELHQRFDADYFEFCKERKRWKTDFEQATRKLTIGFEATEKTT